MIVVCRLYTKPEEDKEQCLFVVCFLKAEEDKEQSLFVVCLMKLEED